MGDQIEGDVEPSRLSRHCVGVAIDGLLIERVDYNGLRLPSRGANFVGDRLQLRLGATGEEYPRALASEGAGNCAADRATRTVDDSVLVFEQHVYLVNS